MKRRRWGPWIPLFPKNNRPTPSPRGFDTTIISFKLIGHMFIPILWLNYARELSHLSWHPLLFVWPIHDTHTHSLSTLAPSRLEILCRISYGIWRYIFHFQYQLPHIIWARVLKLHVVNGGAMTWRRHNIFSQSACYYFLKTSWPLKTSFMD